MTASNDAGKRIAIVGGGGAGLCCAWLLEAAGHDVVLFEQSGRLGGHVHTVEVETGQAAPLRVEAGMRFCSRTGWPLLVRLFEHLGLELDEYDQTLSFHDRADGWTVPLPPTGSLRRWSSLLRPRTLRTLVGFLRLMDRATPLVENGGWEESLGDALERWQVSETLKRDFVLPFIASNWGIPTEDATSLSARVAFSYSCKNRPTAFGSSRWINVRGGLGRYVDAMVASLERTKVESGVGGRIRAITRRGEKPVVVSERGEELMFDEVVLACSAEDAARMIEGTAGTDAVQRLLKRIEYFDTRVALHRDASLLSPNRADWSHLQLVRDRDICAIHEWCGKDAGVDLFRSWITHGERLPESDSVVSTYEYRHPLPTPDHFETQERLSAIQGRGGLWFAGVWAGGFDSHEGAIQSALRVAEGLAPESPRLDVFAGDALAHPDAPIRGEER